MLVNERFVAAGEFAIPVYSHPKVAPDRHVQVGRALYSVPGELIGHRLTAGADDRAVKLFYPSQLIKVRPAMPPGRRSTGPADLPSELTDYALQRKASLHSDRIGGPDGAVAQLRHGRQREGDPQRRGHRATARAG